MIRLAITDPMLNPRILFMFLVISTSLNPQSRSRIMAKHCLSCFSELNSQDENAAQLFDLNDHELPICDGDKAYGAKSVIELTSAIQSATGIVIASPIYNYDLSASAKNMIELTGKAWAEKVVGFVCAAGGQSSYMAPMQMAGSLMLDFRCLVLPQFVYATGDNFQGDEISDADISGRISDLAKRITKVSHALQTIN